MFKITGCFLLLPLFCCLTVSPVNVSCIWGAHYTLSSLNTTIQGYQYALPTITLPPFSYAEIWFDFRAIMLSEDLFPVNIEIGNTLESLTNYRGVASQYSLFVSSKSNISIKIKLDDDYQMYRFLLMNTTTIRVTQAQPRFIDNYSTFLWIVKEDDNINLPYNFPSIKNYTGFFFNKISSSNSTTLKMQPQIQGVNYYSENVEYWSTFSSFVVPYIPYISNCEVVGHNLYLDNEFQEPDSCNIVPINETRPINPFLFGSSAYGDSCNYQLNCMYDESASYGSEYPLWMTLAEEGTMMYITKQEVDYSRYGIIQEFDDEDLVPCIVTQSEGDNSTSRFPTEVRITLGYYQVSQTDKNMISCSVEFGLYTSASDNFTYTLTIEQKPLNHTAILIAFGFEFYIYMMAFVMIGVISNFENITLSVYHWWANRLVRKGFKVKVYIPMLYEIIKGCLTAVSPMLIMGCLISIIMGGHLYNFDISHFRQTSLTSPKVFWDLLSSIQITDYSSSIAESARDGRMGVAFITVGLYLILFTSGHFIGMQRKKEDYQQQQMYGSMINPLLWGKFKFLFGTGMYLCMQLMLLYFAYTKFFGDNIWVFIVSTKVFLIVLEEIVDLIFENIISSMPLKIISNLTSYLNTLAANDFYDFMFSFLIDVAIEMSEKAYLSTIQNITANYTDTKLKQLSVYIDKFLYDGDKEESVVQSDNLSQDSDDYEIEVAVAATDISFEQNQDYDIKSQNSRDIQEEDEQERIFKQLLQENNENKVKGIVEIVEWTEDDEEEEKLNDLLEMMIDVFSVPVNIILQPFAILILWMTYDETQILSNFGITQQITPFYIFSNLTIGPFTIINTILTLFVLQNFHQFQVEEFVIENMDRYIHRKNFWKSDDDEVPTSCELKVRSVVKFCISSQLFFLVVIYTTSMFFVLTGITTMISHGYDPFDDFASLLVIIFWLLITHFAVKATILFSTRVINIWNYKTYDTSRRVFIDESTNKEIEPSRHKLSDMYSVAEEDNVTGLNYDEIVVDHEALSLQKVDHIGKSIEETKSKIASICAKFKPVFEDPVKRMQYSTKHKEFLVQNIDRILGYIELQQLPEEVRNCEVNVKTLPKPSVKKVNLSSLGQKMLKEWLQETKKKKNHAQAEALQMEKNVKKCQFCFGNWGIYYGHGGICLECSQEMLSLKQKKQ